MTDIWNTIWNVFNPVWNVTDGLFNNTLTGLLNIHNNLISVYNQLMNIPHQMFVLFISLVTTILYPASVLITVCYNSMAYMYYLFASIINAMISLPQAAQTMMIVLQTMGFPSVWISLLWMMIVLNLSVRVYNFVRTLIKWTPAKLITGG